MVILIAGLFCLARKRVEYLRNQVFYHRAKGEPPERKKNIKITNKTTPEKTGVRSIPVASKRRSYMQRVKGGHPKRKKKVK